MDSDQAPKQLKLPFPTTSELLVHALGHQLRHGRILFADVQRRITIREHIHRAYTISLTIDRELPPVSVKDCLDFVVPEPAAKVDTKSRLSLLLSALKGVTLALPPGKFREPMYSVVREADAFEEAGIPVFLRAPLAASHTLLANWKFVVAVVTAAVPAALWAIYKFAPFVFPFLLLIASGVGLIGAVWPEVAAVLSSWGSTLRHLVVSVSPKRTRRTTFSLPQAQYALA